LHADSHPTDLNAIEPKAFDRIARHGYEAAKATLAAHSSSHFPSTDVLWPEIAVDA
jgi:NTE family protein